MSSSAVVAPQALVAPGGSSPYLLLRAACWTVALVLGAAQAWATRFTMNPDGISYLDIGDAYWRHDWHNAINAYWSPLYSWILGFFINVIKPTPYWEYPLVHLINFLIYVAALGCFEFFLIAFSEYMNLSSGHLHSESSLSSESYWLIGYAVFVSCSLILGGLQLVTPDLCIASFTYLIAALILRIRTTAENRNYFLLFGLVLGLAYLGKTIIFPLSFVALAAARLADKSKRRNSNLILASTIFLVAAVPFVLAISIAKHRPTFGDSGRINYEIEVQKDNWFIPTVPVMHPVPKLSEQPLAYTFEGPIKGTYPLWYDPSYWHEGATIRVRLIPQFNAARRALGRYWAIISGPIFQLNLALTFVLLFLLARSTAFLKRLWCFRPLLLFTAGALCLYALVVVETRYVAPFFLLAWMSLFGGLELRDKARKDLGEGLCTLALLCVTVLCLVWTFTDRQSNTESYYTALKLMEERGLVAGDSLVSVGTEPEGPDAAFIARLGRMRVVGTSPPDQFWRAAESDRKQLEWMFANLGVKAILCSSTPNSTEDWHKLGTTKYYVLKLGSTQ